MLIGTEDGLHVVETGKDGKSGFVKFYSLFVIC